MRLLFGTIIFLAASCQNPKEKGVIVIDADRVKSLVHDGVKLVDVRTPREYDEGRIKGALLIDFLDKKFDSKVKTLDKSKPIIVYCGVGGRSKKASERLMQMGFETIYDYSEGFSNWRERGEDFER